MSAPEPWADGPPDNSPSDEDYDEAVAQWLENGDEWAEFICEAIANMTPRTFIAPRAPADPNAGEAINRLSTGQLFAVTLDDDYSPQLRAHAGDLLRDRYIAAHQELINASATALHQDRLDGDEYDRED